MTKSEILRDLVRLSHLNWGGGAKMKQSLVNFELKYKNTVFKHICDNSIFLYGHVCRGICE
jgi:hypothetical protein